MERRVGLMEWPWSVCVRVHVHTLLGKSVVEARWGLSSQPETGQVVMVRAPDAHLLDHWSVTRALALGLCRKEFPQRWKVVKQVKY